MGKIAINFTPQEPMEHAGPCPKCGSMSWFEYDGDGVMQRCLCGYLRFMEVTKGGIKITHKVKATEIIIPAAGTKLSKCLGVIIAHHPDPVQTVVVANAIGGTAAELSPHLMVLEYRGLLSRDSNGRGMKGGSYWRLTTKAQEVLGVR